MVSYGLVLFTSDSGTNVILFLQKLVAPSLGFIPWVQRARVLSVQLYTHLLTLVFLFLVAQQKGELHLC